MVPPANWTHLDELDLPASVDAPGLARRFLRAALADVDARFDAGFVDSALLVASELVTNAVVHAGSTSRLAVAVDAARGALRVGVIDRSTSPPQVRDAAWQPPSGRGLRVVERVATVWGVRMRRDGKEIWFELHPQAEGDES